MKFSKSNFMTQMVILTMIFHHQRKENIRNRLIIYIIFLKSKRKLNVLMTIMNHTTNSGTQLIICVAILNNFHERSNQFIDHLLKICTIKHENPANHFGRHYKTFL